MKTITDNFIDLSLLPDSAKQQMIDFYNYLTSKYSKKKRRKNGISRVNELLPKEVKNFKPFLRDEIYGR
ncbi:MAG: hypothetical protein A2X61_00285 [Ignavibacteria bacterium GWB2_35_12]|nr:MAG: hypothetical protein A2X61_00285 [Ignavibacteria bacterium GWB2_35_12]OGU90583.1 MAG: hypothetical protein A2220_12930 [Ignavibacteria bacterium RIFOXYA2_FULL_35_10]OGV23338.1 MAG: hypothetical protein A2475_06760 [Ignavibacteria bacterium RIFOXYC2_FULL_35_21]